MSDPPPDPDRRWPRTVYGVGSEPDPRFSLANERTFLAWIRTALGFMAAGVAVAAIGELSPVLEIETRVLSVALIICGLVCGAGGYWRWISQERAIRLERPLPSTGAMPFIAAVVGLVALAGLLLILLP